MNWKNQLGSFLAIAVMCSLLFGCRTLPPGMAQVTDPAQRYILKDLSVAVPAGEGWYVQMEGENTIYFMKTNAPSHSLVASVKPFAFPPVSINRDQFQKLLKAAFEKEQKNSKRYKDGSFEASPDGRFGDLAVRIHTIVKDFAPVNLPSGTKYLTLNTYAVYFRVPRTDSFLWIMYSERSKPQDGDAALGEKADRFFDSIQLSPAEGKR
jgi:hypothetical protein